MSRAIPKPIREKIKARFDGRCGYCGDKPSKLQIDHMKPYRDFYTDYAAANNEANLIAACFACNSLKNSYNVEQFRQQVSWQLGNAAKYSVNYRTAKRFGQVVEKPEPIVFYFELVAQTTDQQSREG